MRVPSPEFVIVPLLMSDFSALKAVERAGQKTPWPDSELLAEVASEHALHFCVRSLGDASFSAFILCRLIIDELHIHNLCTHPDFRRRGYGRALVLHALAVARSRNGAKAFLEVASSNLPAIALYRSVGFNMDFERKQYYASGENALVMSASLS
jgi:[ribosomal protein S18]-alanine N-acetyltransferase